MIGIASRGMALAAAAAMALGTQAVALSPAGNYPEPAPKQRTATGRVPTGTSFRSLRKAFNQGWRPAPGSGAIKKERQALYMHSHARAMAALIEAIKLQQARG
jgi:hypothetical protein